MRGPGSRRESLYGSAVALVDRLVPAPTAAERDRALRGAIAEAHRHGITSVQDVASGPDALGAYAEARRTGDLGLRIYAALPVVSDLPDADLDRLEVATAKYPDDPIFKAGALSLSLDDSPAATDAADSTSARAPADAVHFDPDTLNRLVRRLDARGWQVLTDAATELSLRMTLTAYEHAVRSNPGRAGERRHRVQNVGAVAAEDLPRFSVLGVLAAMQPLGDRVEADASTEPAGPSAAARVMAARGRLAFGSGWPAAALNPLPGIAAMSKAAADTGGGRLPLKAAIDAYTSGGAWASFDEQRKGTIAAGMLADIVVLSDDIFATSADIPAAKVEVTIFDGKVVYRRGQHATN